MNEKAFSDLFLKTEIKEFLLDHLTAMISYWDKDQKCRFSNFAYFTFCQKTKEDMEGIDIKDFLGDLYKKDSRYIKAVLKGEAQTFERRVLAPGGSTKYYLVNYLPHFVDKKLKGFVCHETDITKVKELQHNLTVEKEKAEYLATHDHLTGLPNRVLLEDRLEQSILNAKRNKKIVSVMTLDLDEFKPINDNYGHAMGDLLLKSVSERLKKVVRATDTVTRFGGDEFIVVATSVVKVNDVDFVANRVLKAIQEPFTIEGHVLKVGLSVGVSNYPEHGDVVLNLMKKSDQALYAAKRKGGKCFVLADVDPPFPLSGGELVIK